MRDYKFRGKTSDGAQWVYGSLINTPDKGPLIEEYDELRRISSQYLVVPESVGQCTETRDCVDHEIYEGDILYDSRDHYVVRYKKEWAAYVVCRISKIDREAVFLLDELVNMVVHRLKPMVIGNIFDNPALMEACDA